MSDFVTDVAGYFQNFLETDFRKRRQPKRNIVSTNKDGTKILVNLDKYPKFKEDLYKKISDSEVFDANFLVKPKKYTASIKSGSTDFFLKSVLSSLDEKKKSIALQFNDQLVGTFVQYIDDIEKFFEKSDDLICEMISKDIFGESSESISATLSRLSEDDSINHYEVENQLGIALFERFRGEFHELLLEFSVQKNPDIFSDYFENLLSDENIKIVVNAYFDSLAINDLFQDLSILCKEIRAKENFDIYLYFGELIFDKKSFPITFIPIEIDDNSSDALTISFEKRYFVNKQAIEYAYQQVTGKKSGSVASVIPERTIILDQHENIADHIKELLNRLANKVFLIPDSFGGAFNQTSSVSANNIKIRNSFFLTIADKGDESALNDYEDILSMIDSGDGLFHDLSDLIKKFINGNPKDISEKVRNDWKKTSTEERLVYESPIPVNEEQRKIIGAVNSKDCKFITVQGPPGTGKSHTISAILFRAIKENKSVLLLSDKKEALDVVEDKLTETLNKVRTDQNFQNPILRIGKTGNNYAKILSRNSIENIRNNYEATKEILSRNKQNLANEIKDLRSSLKQTITTYDNIEIGEIEKYFNLKDQLELDEDDELYLLNSSKKINKLQASIEKLEETFSSLDSNEKQYYLSLTNNFISSLCVSNAALIAEITSADTFGALKENFASLRIKDIELVKQALKDYRIKKTGFLGSIFGNLMLGDWQKDLILNLDLKEMIDFRYNIEVLEFYLNVLNKVKAADGKQASKITDLLINFDIDIKLNEKKFKNLNKSHNNFIENLNSLDDEQSRKILSFLFADTDVLKNGLDNLLEKIRIITEFNNNSASLKTNFNNLKDIRYLDNTLDIQQDTAIEMTQEFDKRFLDFAENNRSDAATFKKVISKKLKFPKDRIHQIRNAFPCIIAGIRDYADYIPLEKEVFDLLVIDEASQVSIAQAFPALIRAKKVLVLGDNKQFSNVKSTTASNEINQSFLNNLRTSALKEFGDDELKKEKAKVFNVRTSILDFFEYTANYSALLKKHFRGYPELISFSSKYFYDGSLQALKVRGKPIEDIIDFNFVNHDGLIEIKGNINDPEAKVILKFLEEQAIKDNPNSVGVITPFRDQQRYILGEVDKSKLRSQIYSKLRLKVMTFDSCQGEERDHIIYSFVENLASKTKCSSVLGSKFEDYMDPEQNLRLQRLNVGMSRAKEKITFMLSQKIEDFTGNALLILNHYREQLDLAKKLPSAKETESPMEKKLLSWIQQSSFYQKNQSKLEITAQFKVSDYIKALDPTYKHPNYRCDFLIQFNDGEKARKAIIEYDGFEYHFNKSENIGEFNYENYYTERDVERERILEGYGFPFIRFNRFNLGKDPVKTVSQKLNSFFLPSR